jgi:hypothetical protein
MTKTPYQIQLDDLPITVEHLLIEMPHFVELLADFSDEIGHNMAVEGKWRDRDLRNAADFKVTINFWNKDQSRRYANLVFTGKFSINKYGAFEVPYLCEKIGKYCYGVIQNYVEEVTIRDKNKVLYPVPEFAYFENQWLKNHFDLP